MRVDIKSLTRLQKIGRNSTRHGSTHDARSNSIFGLRYTYTILSIKICTLLEIRFFHNQINARVKSMSTAKYAQNAAITK